MNTNLINSLAKLKRQGFQGSDASLLESLEVYNLAWKIRKTHTIFVHRTSHGKNWDRTTIENNIDIQKEYDWVKWPDFLKYLGIEQEHFNELSLQDKIFYLICYYGAEEIFGTTYWEGFKIKDITNEI